MKIAIVCDWLVSIGGAEKVLEQMLECYPQAELFSIIDFLPKRETIKNKQVKTSFIQKLPFVKIYYRSYLPLMPIAIEQFDFSDYDIIISSSHAISKGIITSPDQLHICYCHSPIRYAWDMQAQYLKETNLDRGIKSWIVRAFLHKIRLWDKNSIVDSYIANSKYIARRIEKIYGAKSKVIYPPVNISEFELVIKEEYYIAASRVVPYKRLDLIVEAFQKLPQKKLIVIGAGPGLKKLHKLALGYGNIQILGFQEDNVLRDYIQKAKALIFAAQEDFGIIPVEAQSLGTPVIAYARGGALESIIDYEVDPKNATGIFFKEQNVTSIIRSIEFFENISFNSLNCYNNALKFSKEIFKQNFKKFIEDKIKEFRVT